ncbi:MAG TPA: serine hydrolase domain-containing protein [Bacteroidia bacterium]
MNYLAYAFLILSFFSCGPEKAEQDGPDPVYVNQDSLAKFLKKIHAKEKAYRIDTLFKNKVKAGFNACVLVAQHGQVIYKNAFGFADLKTKDSLYTNSAFQLASASKTLTAGAVLLLKDRGKLRLDDLVQKHLPDFPYEGITIQMLLTHRSGLGNYVYFCEPFCDKSNAYNGSCFNNKAMLEIMKVHKPAVYAKPGRKFEYCNTNYALLALIVEKVSGEPFSEFMETNIFKPLGMNDTWVHDVNRKAEGKKVTRGYNGLGKPEDDTYADDVTGDKGVYSTVEDLFKWDRALYSEVLLKKSTIEEAYKGYSNEHKGKRNYGYGWRTVDDGKNPKIIYHNGWWHGYNSLFLRRPSDGTTIIVLSNKFNKTAYRVEGVLRILDESNRNIDIEGE